MEILVNDILSTGNLAGQHTEIQYMIGLAADSRKD